MPHALRALKADCGQLTELSVLCGFDDDLTAQITQVRSRIRGLLTQIHPAAYAGRGAASWTSGSAGAACPPSLACAAGRTRREAAVS